jgi:endoglucanase
LWEAYTHQFLDDQGRVIDHSAGDRTTSEGQAYGMFFALVDNDRAHFDKLLNWTAANLAQGDLTTHLPAWNWGKTSAGEWKALDANSASDADLWMAYTLLEAGRLWHEPRYTDLGRIMAKLIAKNEVVVVPGLGTTVIPGPSGFHPEPDRYTLNPSYLPLPVLISLAHALPQGPWKSVLASLPALLSHQSGGGYAMDWVSVGPDGEHPVAPPSEPTAGKRDSQAGGGYDAIRVYLWLGVADPGTPGLKDLLGALPAMAKYLKTAGTPPLEVDAKGNVVRPDAPVGFSAAVIPYLLATGMKTEAKAQMERIGAMRDPANSLYGKPAEYYDQNLVLFSTGWSEQRYRFDRGGGLKAGWK